MSQNDRGDSLGTTARRTLVFIAIVAIALLLWQIADALLLIFISILPAVFVRGLAESISKHTPLSMGWAIGAVVLALVALVAAGVLLLGPRIAEQFAELSETLPQSIDQLRQSLEQTSWGQYVLGEMQAGDGGLRLGGDIFSQLTGVAALSLSIVTNILLILFAAIFFIANPGLYKQGIVLLVPKDKEQRVAEALDATGNALWEWLKGKLIAMLFVGVFVTLGLLLVGVPLALVLGLIAGLLDFVPFIGPVAAAVPGVLLGITEGPSQALYAALVYFLAQQVEGNLVTPLVQQEQVSLPPVLVLFAIVAAGLVFGILGIIVAEPLIVVLLVLVKMLYIEDVLGKSVHIPGRKRARST